LYDLTDYVNTLKLNLETGPYKFLDDDLVDVFRRLSGTDATKEIQKVPFCFPPRYILFSLCAKLPVCGFSCF